MKQNDIIMVVVIAISGFVASLFVCNTVLGDPDNESVVVDSIKPVSNEVAEPNPEVFNSKAINPTVEVYVGRCEDWDKNGTIDDAEWQACNNTTEEDADKAENAASDSTEE